MASITVSPLNNGITLTSPEVVSGMLTVTTYSPSYALITGHVYYTSTGNVYYQVDAATPATLAHSLGFPVTCAEVFFDGIANNLVFCGSSGNYAQGTLDTSGVLSLTLSTEGVVNFTAIVFSYTAYAFILGTSTGYLYSLDTYGTMTGLQMLTAPSLPSSSTLIISKICYSLETSKYMIVGYASTNVTADPYSADNYSIVYYGDLTTFIHQIFVGSHIWLGAIGKIEGSNGVLSPKFVIAGSAYPTALMIRHSDDCVTWSTPDHLDSDLIVNSLVFSNWVFAMTLQSSTLSLSTNGSVWHSYYDPSMVSAEFVEVVA